MLTSPTPDTCEARDSQELTLTLVPKGTILSDDFVAPDTPDPHWQLVDSKGNVYLLNKLKIKNDGYNKKLAVPGYVKDVKTVQIWCAWAETLLGEASFPDPVK